METGRRTVLLLLTVGLLAAPAVAHAGTWVTENGEEHYYRDDGTMVRKEIVDDYYVNGLGNRTAGWVKDEGFWYYFSEDTFQMVKGWTKIGSFYYFFNEDGQMLSDSWVEGAYVSDSGHRLTGWQQMGSSVYYFSDRDGKAVTGWQEINEEMYFFSAEGVMQTNAWFEREDGMSFVGDDGIMKKDTWITTKEKHYYVDEEGYMKKNGWLLYEDQYYYFSEAGYCYTSVNLKIDGRFYSFNENGVMRTSQWVVLDTDQKGKKLGYVGSNGAFRVGWVSVDKEWYYLNSDYTRAEDCRIKIGNNYYHFNESGKLLSNQWVDYEGERYWLSTDGTYQTNKWTTQGGSWYWLDQSGKMVTENWMKQGGSWYYLQKDGTRAENRWCQIKGNSFYFNADGKMAASSWINTDDKWYYVGSNGAMLKAKWHREGNDWYYQKNNGELGIGWFTVGNHTYFGSKSRPLGKMMTGWIQDGQTGSWYYMRPATSNNMGGARVENGWYKVGNTFYYFNASGVMQTNKWIQDNNNYYYVNGSGHRVTGLQTVESNLYYFNSNGVMQRNTTVNVNGTYYAIDAYGHAKETYVFVNCPTSVKQISDFLFFTWWESKCDYSQAMGPTGDACGYYQFDYRYGLQPFLAYAYQSDPVLCAEFLPYLTVSRTSLHANTGLYNAWKTIYARNPAKFAQLQDTHAKNEYYMPAENALLSKGIDIRNRPDVVKGAVFSYAIQHGAITAANQIAASGANNSMSNDQFLRTIYNYRMNRYSSIYTERYVAELAEALSRL